MGWIVFLAIAIPLVGLVAWVVFNDSFVQIEPGQLGLLVVRGEATDRALPPGPHWVPALRRRTVQAYPSVELSYRAALTPAAASDLERTTPALRLLLGDRTAAAVGFTVRFRLDPAMLREVHNRFGPAGIWTAVQDESARAVRAALAKPGVVVDDLFGPARVELERGVRDDVASALAESGFDLTMFGLGDVDLGETGEVIQATARARLELEREVAEEATRIARADIDVKLGPHLTGPAIETALRYREIDAWRQVAQRAGMTIPESWPSPTPPIADDADTDAAPTPPPEPTP